MGVFKKAKKLVRSVIKTNKKAKEADEKAKKAKEAAEKAKKAKKIREKAEKAEKAKKIREAAEKAKKAKKAKDAADKAEKEKKAAAAAAAAAATEKIRKELCNTITTEDIPKLEMLLAASKTKLQDLEKKVNDCQRNYRKNCNSKQMNTELLNNQNLYTNLKSTLSKLSETYELEKCEVSKSCDLLEKKNALAYSQYNISNSIYKYKRNEYNTCTDPYKNKCAPILKDLEKSKENIDKNMLILGNIESFANIETNKDVTDNLYKFQTENHLVEKSLRKNSSPTTLVDNYLQYDAEVCKNILLTTAGSVMLYYLFFEL